MRLKITTDVQAKLALVPRRVYFGKLRKGVRSPDRYVEIAGTDRDTTKILFVESRNKFIRAEVVPFTRKDGSKGKRIRVTVLPGMKVGRFNEWVAVHTDHKEKKKITFHVYGEITGNIMVLPQYLSFGMFRKGGKYERKIRLKAAPGVSFRVLDVKSTTPDLIPNLLTIREGTDYWVEVCMKESFDKDTLNGKIIITTDDKDQQYIEVTVTGRAFKERMKGRRPGNARGMKKRR